MKTSAAAVVQPEGKEFQTIAEGAS
jgi:hypothetical protein